MRIAAAPLVLLLAAGTDMAEAALVEVTWQGTVSEGVDYAGLFGPEGAALDGTDYVATYLFDTERGIRESSRGDRLYGGEARGAESPLVEATLTIGSMTERILGLWDAYALAASSTPDGFGYFLQIAEDRRDDGSVRRLNHSWQAEPFIGLPGSVEDAFARDGLGDAAPGRGEGIVASFLFAPCGGCRPDAFGTLRPDRVTARTVPEPAPVPLPAAGCLMAAGLLAAGAVRCLRRL